MSVRQRLAFALIAVVIAVVAVVAIASGGGSDDGADRASSTDAVTAPEATPEPEATQEPSAAREPEPTRAPVPKVVVKGGEPVGGVEEIEATEGERIRFTVVSDVADHVHVHGYDLMKDVSAGGQATFSFKATITGIFEAELEDRAEEIVSLRVDPK